MHMKYWAIGVLSLFSSGAYAKVCTEADLRASADAGVPFDYLVEGCENPEGKITVSETIIVRKDGMTIDGRDQMKLVWTGPGECNKLPTNYAAITIKASRVTLKNFAVHGAPDGLHVTSGDSNVIDHVVFPYVCEDAITNGNKKPTSATNTLIKNSYFANSDDKAIQSNGGSLRVENCRFTNVFRSIGVCSEKADPGWHDVAPCPVASHVEAVGNVVTGCKGYAMRAAGKRERGANGTLRAWNNQFIDCAPAFQAEEDGDVYAAYNKISGKCDFVFRTLANGKIRACGNSYTCRKWKAPGSDVTESCE